MSISNTDDTISVSDITDRVEELRDQRTHKYVAGWNMPGYMPDSEPAEFDDADDARQYIIDAMEEEADSIPNDSAGNHENGATEDELRECAIDLTRCSDEGSAAEFGRTIGRFHYFVTYQGVTGLDEDETEELKTLESILDDLQGEGGDHRWEGNWYPATLIRETYFETYAEELAQDIGAIPNNVGWPCNCIDWEKAARELRQDYSETDFDGVAYYFRR